LVFQLLLLSVFLYIVYGTVQGLSKVERELHSRTAEVRACRDAIAIAAETQQAASSQLETLKAQVRVDVLLTGARGQSWMLSLSVSCFFRLGSHI
jgi:hypothetical protein